MVEQLGKAVAMSGYALLIVGYATELLFNIKIIKQPLSNRPKTHILKSKHNKTTEIKPTLVTKNDQQLNKSKPIMLSY